MYPEDGSSTMAAAVRRARKEGVLVFRSNEAGGVSEWRWVVAAPGDVFWIGSFEHRSDALSFCRHNGFCLKEFPHAR